MSICRSDSDLADALAAGADASLGEVLAFGRTSSGGSTAPLRGPEVLLITPVALPGAQPGLAFFLTGVLVNILLFGRPPRPLRRPWVGFVGLGLIVVVGFRPLGLLARNASRPSAVLPAFT